MGRISCGNARLACGGKVRLVTLQLPSGLPPEYRGREQTFVKHLILREYIERVGWNILSFADEFVFVDGFSGPWKARTENYTDTSFGIAIDKLRLLKTRYPD